jgi:hypothetical protein
MRLPLRFSPTRVGTKPNPEQMIDGKESRTAGLLPTKNFWLMAEGENLFPDPPAYGIGRQQQKRSNARA